MNNECIIYMHTLFQYIEDKTLLMTTIGLAVGVVIIFITVTIMCGVYKRKNK